MNRFGLSKVTLILITLLIASNLSIYLTLYSENRRLRSELELVRLRLEEGEGYIKWLEMEVEKLNASYRRVLEANRKLEEALRYLHGKLILPYNFTLITLSEFYDKVTFKYTDEMIEFVSNATGWWDGSWEDLLSDLYRIYRSWRDYYIIDGNFTMPDERLPFINIGGWNYYDTYLDDRYLGEVLFYEDNPIMVPIDYVARYFKYHRGTCGGYAYVLTTLYYIYADITGVNISAAYLSITIGGEASHACVLLKNRDGVVAIVDWEPITAENGMIKLLPIDTVKALHSRYWFGLEIEYNGVWMRPNNSRRFSSYEEFKEWVIGEFM
ncbi:MAG: hypothetical protein QW374_02760 [Candidatus Bathyarchaeia archaeon]|nr:hypothetical protein [Candidatus Bathyarchaeota archaeon]